MFVLNNNGDSLYTRTHKMVETIPGDQVCVVYLGGEGIKDFDKGSQLSDIIANEILLEFPEISKVPNYAYVYNGTDQRPLRRIQFERHHKNLFEKLPQPSNLPKKSEYDELEQKPEVTNFYITKQNLHRVFKTQVAPALMHGNVEIDKGNLLMCFVVDGDMKTIKPILIKKLRELSNEIPDKNLARLVKMQLTEKIVPYEFLVKKDYSPEIFNSTILPRITDKYGKRLTANRAAINMRKMNFILHCGGAYMFLRLGEIMKTKMRELGYSADEIKLVQSQTFGVALNPACPLGVADMRVISFTSVYDARTPRPANWISKFLYTNVEQETKTKCDWDLQPGFLSGKNGDVFYIKQRFTLAEGIVSYHEHNNMHYVHERMTDAGRELMQLSRNVIVSGIKNSLKQKTKLVPLPKLDELILDGKNDDQITERFTEMKRNGRKFMNDVYKHATATVHARNAQRIKNKRTDPTKIITR